MSLLFEFARGAVRVTIHSEPSGTVDEDGWPEWRATGVSLRNSTGIPLRYEAASRDGRIEIAGETTDEEVDRNIGGNPARRTMPHVFVAWPA